MPTVDWPGPRRSVEALAARLGHAAVVAGCLELLDGGHVDGEVVHALGGPPARWAVAGGAAGPDSWLRVWALRGLLWQWAGSAGPAVVRALSDEAWRVREMAARVAARHGVDAALEPLLALRDDRVPRVRAAARRAVEELSARPR